MAKQDWSTRMVWVVGFDAKQEFFVEVYQEEEDAQKAGAAFVLQVLKERWRDKELAQAKEMFQRKEYADVLQLHEELISEFAYADEYVMIWHERIK